MRRGVCLQWADDTRQVDGPGDCQHGQVYAHVSESLVSKLTAVAPPRRFLARAESAQDRHADAVFAANRNALWGALLCRLAA